MPTSRSRTSPQGCHCKKALTAAERGEAITHLVTGHGLPVQRACQKALTGSRLAIKHCRNHPRGAIAVKASILLNLVPFGLQTGPSQTPSVPSVAKCRVRLEQEKGSEWADHQGCTQLPSGRVSEHGCWSVPFQARGKHGTPRGICSSACRLYALRRRG